LHRYVQPSAGAMKLQWHPKRAAACSMACTRSSVMFMGYCSSFIRALHVFHLRPRASQGRRANITCVHNSNEQRPPSPPPSPAAMPPMQKPHPPRSPPSSSREFVVCRRRLVSPRLAECSQLGMSWAQNMENEALKTDCDEK
jgi:hypothetical protein